eukprot:1269301-Prymnesium_polylepis.1
MDYTLPREAGGYEHGKLIPCARVLFDKYHIPEELIGGLTWDNYCSLTKPEGCIIGRGFRYAPARPGERKATWDEALQHCLTRPLTEEEISSLNPFERYELRDLQSRYPEVPDGIVPWSPGPAKGSRGQRKRVRDKAPARVHASDATREAVLGDVNLVETILRGRIGPAMFASCSLVCVSWYNLTRRSMPLLRSVALYSTGLDRETFSRLLGVNMEEVKKLPQTMQERKPHGFFWLLGEAAVDRVLRPGPDAMRQWHAHLYDGNLFRFVVNAFLRDVHFHKGTLEDFDRKVATKPGFKALYAREERMYKRFVLGVGFESKNPYFQNRHTKPWLCDQRMLKLDKRMAAL